MDTEVKEETLNLEKTSSTREIIKGLTLDITTHRKALLTLTPYPFPTACVDGDGKA